MNGRLGWAYLALFRLVVRWTTESAEQALALDLLKQSWEAARQCVRSK